MYICRQVDMVLCKEEYTQVGEQVCRQVYMQVQVGVCVGRWGRLIIRQLGKLRDRQESRQVGRSIGRQTVRYLREQVDGQVASQVVRQVDRQVGYPRPAYLPTCSVPSWPTATCRIPQRASESSASHCFTFYKVKTVFTKEKINYLKHDS